MLTIHPFIEQQTLHINPTNEERRPTNAPFTIIFFIIICFWLVIIVAVFSKSPTDAISIELEYGLIVIDDIYPRFDWEFPVGLVLSGLIVFIYIWILSQDRAKYIVHFAMTILYCLIFLILAGVIIVTRGFSNNWVPINLKTILGFISLVFLICYIIESLLCACHIGIEPIFKIIRDACRALLCCPISISIFIILMSFIIILIFVFSVYITILIFYTESDESSINWISIGNVYCTFAVMGFFINFTQVVISGYIMDWFWSKDPNVNYTISLKRNFERILNYHMGSVAFFSTPLMPTLCSLYQMCGCQDSDDGIVRRSNWFTRFISQLYVFRNLADFGMIQTSIYGYEATTAIKAAHDLVSQNNYEFSLAVCTISDTVVTFGLFFISIPYSLGNIVFCMFGLVIPFYIVLKIAFRTLLVNRMIIDYTSEAFKVEYNNVNPAAVL